MKDLTRRAIVPALLALVVAAAPALADTSAGLAAISESSVQSSVGYLASDELQGRGSGAPGGALAGDWLADQLEALGVPPAGLEGTYFQPFEAAGQHLRNVLGALPGREPGEAIVIGAHYDHLGLGHQDGSLEFLRGRGKVHNGADDNASGTAAVLEVARAFMASGLQPRRRVIFAFFDGEERGLLGSNHYVKAPPVPGERVTLMINMDMVGRLRDRVTIYGAPTGDRLGEWLARANEPVGLSLDVKKSLASNSDHWPFYQAGVPVLMPFTGLHPDYHRPSDDTERLNVAGIARIARLSFGVAAIACEADETPVYAQVPDGTGEAMLEQLQAMLGDGDGVGEALEELGEQLGLGDGFGLDKLGERLEELFSGGGRGDRGQRGGRPRLGITLEQDDARPGVGVRAVTGGSIADRAGLRAGDRIVRFDGQEVRDAEALRRLVADARGPVEVTIEREGGEATVTAEFPGQRVAPRPKAEPTPVPAPGGEERRWF